MRPRRLFIVSGGELNQRCVSRNSGAAPSTGSSGVVTPGSAASVKPAPRALEPVPPALVTCSVGVLNFDSPRSRASRSSTAAERSRPPVGFVKKLGNSFANAL